MKVNSVQPLKRSFTKKLYGLRNFRLSREIVSFGLNTLELQRLYLDLILASKIIFNVVDVDCHFQPVYFNARTLL